MNSTKTVVYDIGLVQSRGDHEYPDPLLLPQIRKANRIYAWIRNYSHIELYTMESDYSPMP